MFHTISSYTALTIFFIGMVYKISAWFRHSVGPDTASIPTSTRVVAAAKGTLSVLFSRKLFTLIRVFVLDVVFQARILRQSPLRWVIHLCLFIGFMALLLMHALDDYTAYKLFSEYYPTVNPFMFLRDLFGVLLILGLGLAVCRRLIWKTPRFTSNAMDTYTLVILIVIAVSGVLLEGSRIVSHSIYQDMVDEYTGGEDEEELTALETYWVKEFAVVSPNVREPFDSEVLQQGKMLHEMNCGQCHAQPQWAFASYLTAKTIFTPIARQTHGTSLPVALTYVHFLACLFGLAYLPFSKMLHVFTAPLSLMANAVMSKEESEPANIATRQVMELDACLHCGGCTSLCSVAVAYEQIPNLTILPSEKIPAIKRIISDKNFAPEVLKTIQQGMYLCTNCYRCTTICPAGINLADLWFNVRETLFQKALPESLLLSPLSFHRGLAKELIEPNRYEMPLEQTKEAIATGCDLTVVKNKDLPVVPGNNNGPVSRLQSFVDTRTYLSCYRCSTCSNVCPVVRNYPDALEALDLLPHQIMHAAGMRLWDFIFSSRMLWDCLGCYECQEHCPQCVCITDILYELKGMAISHTIDKQPQDKHSQEVTEKI